MTNQAVAVVTGGGGQIGLETARLLGRDHHVVLSDPSRERLHRSLDRLDSLGVSAESIVADVTDRRSVDVLMAAASSAGHVAAVVHAGSATSPADSPATIVRARVLGTIHVTAATLAVAGRGTTLVHLPVAATPVSSITVPRWLFRLAPADPEGLVATLVRLATLVPARTAPAAAHALSATFVDRYIERMTPVFQASGAHLHPVGDASAAEACRSARVVPDGPVATSAA